MSLEPRKLAQSHQSEAPSSQDADGVADLNREAANMRELLSRQSGRATPLHISSQAAQAVLKQF